MTVEDRIAALQAKGVRVLDPRQTWIDEQVDLTRIHPGAEIHPGTRLQGRHCLVAPGAVVGSEGPATLVDAALGEKATVRSGFLQDAVLLEGASAGYGSHFRPGTVLEEGASTAHCVGLKHTILMSFVTLGSLVNFCDCLMAGGTGRRDHSEVGSGFIHFNFTPWGASGDKMTFSLFGDVPLGVFLREPRIFLGGSGGAVGPRMVGYGSVTGAGQVLRRDVPEGQLVVEGQRTVDVPVPRRSPAPGDPRVARCRRHVGHLVALREWYRQVRLPRARSTDHRRLLVEEAIRVLGICIDGQVAQIGAFLAETGTPPPRLPQGGFPPCPISPAADDRGHVEWVKQLDEDRVALGASWLRDIVERVSERA